MTKAFISYHHRNDQPFREHLSFLANRYGAFEDCSVEVGDIDDSLPPQTIRKIIRDDFLRDTQVTILLCGTETRHRKHIDWELKSSMIDGPKNRRSGILVIDLPTTRGTTGHAALPNEKALVYPENTSSWYAVTSKFDYQQLYPDMPERIIDNLLKPSVNISVVQWERIAERPDVLKFLVDATAASRFNNDYDLSLPMRMRDHNPANHRIFERAS